MGDLHSGLCVHLCHFFLNHQHFALCLYCLIEVLLFTETQTHFLARSEPPSSFLFSDALISLLYQCLSSLPLGRCPLFHGTDSSVNRLHCLLSPNSESRPNAIVISKYSHPTFCSKQRYIDLFFPDSLLYPSLFTAICPGAACPGNLWPLLVIMAGLWYKPRLSRSLQICGRHYPEIFRMVCLKTHLTLHMQKALLSALFMVSARTLGMWTGTSSSLL